MRTEGQTRAARSAVQRFAPGRVNRAMQLEGQAVPKEARTPRMRRAYLHAALAELAEGAGVMGEDADDGEQGRLEPPGRLYSRKVFRYTGAADVRPVGRGIRLLDVLSDDGVPNPELAAFLDSGYWDVKIEMVRRVDQAAPEKTLADHRADRRAFVLDVLGVHDDPATPAPLSLAWEVAKRSDPDVPPLSRRLLLAIAQRQRWRMEYDRARELHACGPPAVPASPTKNSTGDAARRNAL